LAYLAKRQGLGTEGAPIRKGRRIMSRRRAVPTLVAIPSSRPASEGPGHGMLEGFCKRWHDARTFRSPLQRSRRCSSRPSVFGKSKATMKYVPLPGDFLAPVDPNYRRHSFLFPVRRGDVRDAAAHCLPVRVVYVEANVPALLDDIADRDVRRRSPGPLSFPGR
jgi:hypothetical protein